MGLDHLLYIVCYTITFPLTIYPPYHRHTHLCSIRPRLKTWSQADIASLAHTHLLWGGRARRPARLVLQLSAFYQDDEVEFDDPAVAIRDTSTRACGGLALELKFFFQVGDVDFDVAEDDCAWKRDWVSLVLHEFKSFAERPGT